MLHLKVKNNSPHPLPVKEKRRKVVSKRGFYERSFIDISDTRISHHYRKYIFTTCIFLILWDEIKGSFVHNFLKWCSVNILFTWWKANCRAYSRGKLKAYTYIVLEVILTLIEVNLSTCVNQLLHSVLSRHNTINIQASFY